MKNVVYQQKIKVYIDSDRLEFLSDMKKVVDSKDVVKRYDVAFQKAFHNEKEEPVDKQLAEKNGCLALLEAIHENDVFIYDLNNCRTESLRLFLKLIKSMKLKSKKKLIILSNVLTWEELGYKFKKEEEKEVSVISDYEIEPSKATSDEIDEKEESDNEEKEESDNEQSDNENGEEEEAVDVIDIDTFTDEQYLLRKGKGKYQRFINAENLAIDLSKSVSELTVHIVCPGLIYGNTNEILFDLFKQAWLQVPPSIEYIVSLEPIPEKPKIVKEGSEEEVEQEAEEEPEINLEGLSDNEYNAHVREKRLRKACNNIPMTHYDDLLVFLKYLIIEELKDFKYIIATDNAKKSKQIDLIKSVSSKIGGNSHKETSLEECQYNEGIKRHLTLDVSLKTSNLFREYKRKLKKLAEEEEAENEVEEDEEEEKTEKPPKEELIKYNLNFKKGFVSNIVSIKNEFCQLNSLKSNKIIVIGDQLSGKSFIAKRLAKHFKVPYINIDTIMKEFLLKTDDFAEEVKTMIEERKEEQKTLLEEQKERRKKQNKLKLAAAPIAKSLLSEDMLVRIIKLKFNENICLNRGYVFDGFFKDYKMVSEIFRSKLNSKKPRYRGHGGAA